MDYSEKVPKRTKVHCSSGTSNQVVALNGKLTCPEKRWIKSFCRNSQCPGACSGVGNCIEGQCLCQPGWLGADCSEESCPNDCSGHGVCAQDQRCYCSHGFTGPSCGTNATARIDCNVTSWYPWAECRSGISKRVRDVLESPANGGRPCPDVVEFRDCDTNGCLTSPWGNWSSCINATKSRSRTLMPASNTDACNSVALNITTACTVPCLVGEWSLWTNCAPTYPGSEVTVKQRSRNIIRKSAHGGMACPELQQQAVCHHGCKTGWVYTECGSDCVKTCAQPHPMCEPGCVAKCICPPDRPFMEFGACVPKDRCKSVAKILSVNVYFEGFSPSEFSVGIQTTFLRVLSDHFQVKQEFIYIKSILEHKSGGLKESRRLTGATAVEIQIETNQFEFVPLDARVRSALASGSLLSLLRDERPIFKQAELSFVSSQSLPESAIREGRLQVLATEIEWTRVAYRISQSLLVPSMIFALGFVMLCMGLAYVVQIQNAKWDALMLQQAELGPVQVNENTGLLSHHTATEEQVYHV